MPQPNGDGATEFERVVLNSFDLGEAETQLIARALEVAEGNRTRAAELLGLSVRTLRNKLNAQARA
jgi:DNA-binding protein Fis